MLEGDYSIHMVQSHPTKFPINKPVKNVMELSKPLPKIFVIDVTDYELDGVITILSPWTQFKVGFYNTNLQNKGQKLYSFQGNDFF